MVSASSNISSPEHGVTVVMPPSSLEVTYSLEVVSNVLVLGSKVVEPTLVVVSGSFVVVAATGVVPVLVSSIDVVLSVVVLVVVVVKLVVSKIN